MALLGRNMFIKIESDKDISEITIKFADGTVSATNTSVSSTSVPLQTEDYNIPRSSASDLLDRQASAGLGKIDSDSSVEVPTPVDISNRTPLVDSEFTSLSL